MEMVQEVEKFITGLAAAPFGETRVTREIEQFCEKFGCVGVATAMPIDFVSPTGDTIRGLVRHWLLGQYVTAVELRENAEAEAAFNEPVSPGEAGEEALADEAGAAEKLTAEEVAERATVEELSDEELAARDAEAISDADDEEQDRVD